MRGCLVFLQPEHNYVYMYYIRYILFTKMDAWCTIRTEKNACSVKINTCVVAVRRRAETLETFPQFPAIVAAVLDDVNFLEFRLSDVTTNDTSSLQASNIPQNIQFDCT